eukprot:1189003-Prorocentrum_minimum.AAC.1
MPYGCCIDRGRSACAGEGCRRDGFDGGAEGRARVLWRDTFVTGRDGFDGGAGQAPHGDAAPLARLLRAAQDHPGAEPHAREPHARHHMTATLLYRDCTATAVAAVEPVQARHAIDTSHGFLHDVLDRFAIQAEAIKAETTTVAEGYAKVRELLVHRENIPTLLRLIGPS